MRRQFLNVYIANSSSLKFKNYHKSGRPLDKVNFFKQITFDNRLFMTLVHKNSLILIFFYFV